MKFILALRTFDGIYLDVNVLAIGATPAQIAVNQKIGFDLVWIYIFVDADELLGHAGIITQAFRRYEILKIFLPSIKKPLRSS